MRISRLVLLGIPQAGAMLFGTVPHEWVRDRAPVERTRTLVDTFPRHIVARDTASKELFIFVGNRLDKQHESFLNDCFRVV